MRARAIIRFGFVLGTLLLVLQQTGAAHASGAGAVEAIQTFCLDQRADARSAQKALRKAGWKKTKAKRRSPFEMVALLSPDGSVVLGIGQQDDTINNKWFVTCEVATQNGNAASMAKTLSRSLAYKFDKEPLSNGDAYYHFDGLGLGKDHPDASLSIDVIPNGKPVHLSLIEWKKAKPSFTRITASYHARSLSN